MSRAEAACLRWIADVPQTKPFPKQLKLDAAKKTLYRIGRSRSNSDLYLDSAKLPGMISRAHATIELVYAEERLTRTRTNRAGARGKERNFGASLHDSEGASVNVASWEIRDVGSLNGVYVNDIKLDLPQILQEGDIVVFGTKSPSTEFKFVFQKGGQLALNPRQEGDSSTQEYLERPVSARLRKRTRNRFGGEETRGGKRSRKRPVSPQRENSTERRDPAETASSEEGGHGSQMLRKAERAKGWSEEQVIGWAKKVGLSSRVISVLTAHHIDGRALSTVTNDALRDEMGLGAYGDRQALLFELNFLFKTKSRETDQESRFRHSRKDMNGRRRRNGRSSIGIQRRIMTRSASFGKDPERFSWECSQCTLRNPLNRYRCDACQSVRPRSDSLSTHSSSNECKGGKSGIKVEREDFSSNPKNSQGNSGIESPFAETRNGKIENKRNIGVSKDSIQLRTPNKSPTKKEKAQAQQRRRSVSRRVSTSPPRPLDKPKSKCSRNSVHTSPKVPKASRTHEYRPIPLVTEPEASQRNRRGHSIPKKVSKLAPSTGEDAKFPASTNVADTKNLAELARSKQEAGPGPPISSSKANTKGNGVSKHLSRTVRRIDDVLFEDEMKTGKGDTSAVTKDGLKHGRGVSRQNECSDSPEPPSKSIDSSKGGEKAKTLSFRQPEEKKTKRKTSSLVQQRQHQQLSNLAGNEMNEEKPGPDSLINVDNTDKLDSSRTSSSLHTSAGLSRRKSSDAVPCGQPELDSQEQARLFAPTLPSPGSHGSQLAAPEGSPVDSKNYGLKPEKESYEETSILALLYGNTSPSRNTNEAQKAGKDAEDSREKDGQEETEEKSKTNIEGEEIDAIAIARVERENTEGQTKECEGVGCSNKRLLLKGTRSKEAIDQQEQPRLNPTQIHKIILLMDNAAALMHKKKYPAALDVLTQAKKLCGKAETSRDLRAEVLHRAATCHAKLGDLVQAHQACDESLSLRPSSPKRHKMRGVLYAREHKWDESEQSFQLGLSFVKDFAPALPAYARTVMHRKPSSEYIREIEEHLKAVRIRKKRHLRKRRREKGERGEGKNERLRPEGDTWKQKSMSKKGGGERGREQTSSARLVPSPAAPANISTGEAAQEHVHTSSSVSSSSLQPPQKSTGTRRNLNLARSSNTSSRHSPKRSLENSQNEEKGKARGGDTRKFLHTPTPLPDTKLNEGEVFPIMTSDGLRDILGAALWVDALAQEAKIVKKMSSERGALLAKCHSHKEMTYSHREVVKVVVEFNEDRVKLWRCSCKSRASLKQLRPQKPCIHIACTLVALANKQKQEGFITQTEASDVVRPSLYVPPDRQMDTRMKVKEAKLLQGFETKTNATLQKLLQVNNQATSGKKEELVKRCADGALRGALPGCPRCRRGHLIYVLYKYWCNGYYTENGVVECPFTSEDVTRTPWKSL